ncbi:HNH endonuclease [Halomonas desiderata]|uniref:HNH endonuclease n=1 Tax=Billgrantia desiderata TaxID=52021 RepID=UPI00174D8A55|nr:HNH endonuclease [Halomonas desiderata]
MKLQVDLSELFAAANRMGPPVEDGFVLDVVHEPWEDKLGAEGIELEDIRELVVEDGLLSYRGRQVLLYIQDHGGKIQEALLNPDAGKRFHVSECRTLHDMRNKGRFERYVVTNDISGEFRIAGYDYMSGQPIEGKAALKVCKNCLKYLNYKGYSKPGNYSAFSSFDLDEFFQSYSSFFSHHPRRRMGEEEGYARDWSEVSRDYRQSKGYVCEQCKVSLAEYPRLLHVHHINGVKNDNRLENLKALCADCHSKEAFHQGMYVSHTDRQAISRLRREQGFSRPENWKQVIDLADSGLRGLIELCIAEGLSVPEVGLDLADDQGEIKGMLELAWTRKKVAVVIDVQDREFAKSQGWKVFGVHDAIESFEKIKAAL